MNRALPAVVAVVAVLAGCASVPPATVQTDAPGTGSVDVRGGSLPVDANATFDRVAGLVPWDPAPPGYVRVLTDDDLRPGNRSNAESEGQSFAAVLGVVPEPDGGADLEYRFPASTTSRGVVSVHPGDKPPGLTETILAHEYVQFRRRHATRLRERTPATTDGDYVVRAILEGTAVVVTDAYVRRHVPDVDSNARLYDRIAAAVAPGTPAQYGNSRYVFGTRYVAGRLADPSEMGSVVDRPPTTSEQVIHGYAPGEEPPRNLSVTVAGSDAWRGVGTDTMGEAFLRVALHNGLDGPAADRVAAGWGNDSLWVLRRNGTEAGVAYAWTIRWDDAENATEFVDGVRTYLDARGNRTDAGWRVDGRRFRLQRPTDATTVLLAGPESFVGDTVLRGEDGTITVAPPGRLRGRARGMR